MSTKKPLPYLPPDILLYIIDFLLPPPSRLPVALSPSHPTTRTLLSLTRTSRITYPTAVRLLHAHCAYINSGDRLRYLVTSLASLSALTAGVPAPALQLRILPHIPAHHCITSLYLSPFVDGIIDVPTCRLICDLFSLIAPNLRRLVADVRFRTMEQLDDYLTVRTMLRAAFTQLTALELFCSVYNELGYINSVKTFNDATPVWSLWPKLKTLALYHPNLKNPQLWPSLGKLGNLETLVLTRSYGLEAVDMKEEWRKHSGDKERQLTVVLVNVESDHEIPMGRERWSQEDKLVVRELNVPTSYYGDEDNKILCRDWVKRRILRAREVATWT